MLHQAPFLRPQRSRPAAGAGASTLEIRGIEVIQSIQGIDNAVTLIADKPCVVRVYPVLAQGPRAFKVHGELTWRRSGGGAHYLPSSAPLRLRRGSEIFLKEQRLDFSESLNFRLPSSAIEAGKLELALNRIHLNGGDDIQMGNLSPIVVDFVSAPILRVRAVGLRYRSRTLNQSFAPDAVHFSYFRSFLVRAFPVARIEWSQIVVNADFDAPFTGSTPVFANAQLAAMRSREISAGIDPRTHYYGLVDDANGRRNHFMRGLASGIPDFPSPDTVASGPVGAPGGFAGDQDRSYADWYSAHELGHTFGRFHPGFPPGAQDASDPTFPYPDGRITDGDNKLIGLDAGDPELGLSPRVLSGEEHHDIMTYADNQWVSEYTFNAILERLRQEESLFTGMSRNA